MEILEKYDDFVMILVMCRDVSWRFTLLGELHALQTIFYRVSKNEIRTKSETRKTQKNGFYWNYSFGGSLG